MISEAVSEVRWTFVLAPVPLAFRTFRHLFVSVYNNKPQSITMAGIKVVKDIKQKGTFDIISFT